MQMNLSTLHKPIERGEAFYRRMNKPCDDSLDSRKSNSTWAIQQLMLLFKVAIPLFVIVGLVSLIRGVGQVATGQQGLSGLGVKPYENGLSNLRVHDIEFSPVHHSRALLTSNYIALEGSENKINTYTASNQQTPTGSLLPNGDLFIVWSSNAQDGANGGIYGKIVTINGIESVSEFRINTETVNDQSVPSIATSSNGNSLVAWQSNLQDGSAYGIYAQIVSETGSKVGSEFRVNTYTDSDQKAP